MIIWRVTYRFTKKGTLSIWSIQPSFNFETIIHFSIDHRSITQNARFNFVWFFGNLLLLDCYCQLVMKPLTTFQYIIDHLSITQHARFNLTEFFGLPDCYGHRRYPQRHMLGCAEVDRNECQPNYACGIPEKNPKRSITNLRETEKISRHWY